MNRILVSATLFIASYSLDVSSFQSKLGFVFPLRGRHLSFQLNHTRNPAGAVEFQRDYVDRRAHLALETQEELENIQGVFLLIQLHLKNSCYYGRRRRTTSRDYLLQPVSKSVSAQRLLPAPIFALVRVRRRLDVAIRSASHPRSTCQAQD
ncbi:hypothetical protein C8R46DRAFT_1122001 [Mycena filopes]|nr:hypothetical protein C8R46DRAFT_1122001 [Mycena filopes]